MIIYIIIGFCSLVMIAVGVYAYRKQEPMWFWSGSEDEVKKENYTDVKAYNHANGIMWILYGLSFFLPAVLTTLFHLNKWVYMLLFIGDIVGGFIIMILYYGYLHDKYIKHESVIDKNT